MSKEWTDKEWFEYYASRISREVYRATQDFEAAEHEGRISGNGHHIRQKLAEVAVAVLRHRWNEAIEGKAINLDKILNIDL